jgi:hypothetical protein
MRRDLFKLADYPVRCDLDVKKLEPKSERRYRLRRGKWRASLSSSISPRNASRCCASTTAKTRI